MMAVAANGVWWAALALSAAAVAYRLLALWAVLAWRPASGPGWDAPPRLTVLKPLCGMEDGLEEALASFLAQETDFPVRFVFGAARADDPALALARTLAARHPQHPASFVVDAALHGPNRKVSNLVNMARGGLDELVAISDSDVIAPPGALQGAVDALSDPRLGAVTSLYRARPGRAGDRVRAFGAWYLDYWALPMAALHARLGELDVTYGPLTVVRREALEKGGGLAALAHHLCDDAALGRLVLAGGWKLGFAPRVVETLVNDARPRDLFAHELRWSRTDRGEHPVGNLATVVSHPGPLPLLLLLHPGWLAALGVLLPLVLRWVIARAVERRFGRAESAPRPGLVGLWLRDLACFAVWFAGLFSSTVEWRGQRLSVRGGLLQPEQAG